MTDSLQAAYLGLYTAHVMLYSLLWKLIVCKLYTGEGEYNDDAQICDD